jgi:hypothetical protein
LCLSGGGDKGDQIMNDIAEFKAKCPANFKMLEI